MNHDPAIVGQVISWAVLTIGALALIGADIYDKWKEK